MFVDIKYSHYSDPFPDLVFVAFFTLDFCRLLTLAMYSFSNFSILVIGFGFSDIIFLDIEPFFFTLAIYSFSNVSRSTC